MSTLYGADLALIHHEGHGAEATGAGRSILAALRRAGLRGGTIVDLGCGSGTWLRAVQRAGYRPVGVDDSAAMLALARRVAPDARLRLGSVWSTPLPRCAAVTALGEVLNYQPAGAPAALFRRVARALDPGGMFVFDALVDREGRNDPPMQYRLWNAARDRSWYVLVDVQEQPRRQSLRREIVTFRKMSGIWRMSEERHVLRVYRRANLVAALRGAGFAVRVARSYGRQPLRPRRLAFFARKRSPTP